MSQVSAVFGTDDDAEILKSLYQIANVRTTGPTRCPLSLFSPCTEHQWARLDTRGAVDLQRDGLHQKLVCMGQQLLCGNDSGFGRQEALLDSERKQKL